MAATLALGGCELLAALDDDSAAATSAAAESAAKAPLPPPPAPRLSRLPSRRAAADRAVAVDVPAAGESPGEATVVIVATAASRAPETAPAIEAPPRPVATPDILVGLTENELAAWLGDPADRREESPARVWRYDGEGCVLDVFLYLDLVSRRFRALSYDIRGSNRDDQRCLHPVFAGRGDPPRTAARRAD